MLANRETDRQTNMLITIFCSPSKQYLSTEQLRTDIVTVQSLTL